MTANLHMRSTIALLTALSAWSVIASAQGNPSEICKQIGKNGNPISHACNGISIGAPKVFDNRTLTLMLNALSQTLSAQQQNYIDQKSVLAALANIQGYSQRDTSTSLNITGSPTPATSLSTTLNTGLVGASGNPLPNTTTTTATRTQASVTPQAPTLDTTPTFQGFNPTYGSSASDLLNDQVNLTYQIFNLRMILERALSDRLLDKDYIRLQTVLGFNVTIDPPRTANDAVAVVEITLSVENKPESNSKQPLSLVALMPQEKTYNAAALSSKSNAFGGSAAVSAFQVGFSARKRSQIFYLYRDNDTLSYERMTGDSNKIVFGWMFRPVLGRRSVSPGLRQLFSILALPNNDCTKDELNTFGDACTAHLTTTVRTYWKKYDRATLTSFESRDTNRANQFWYALSMGLARPQIFNDGKYMNEANYGDIIVRSSADYQKSLQPKVAAITWRPTGAKSIIISARGNNFFSGTQVALGDKIYAEGTGLTLKSDQAFDLVTTLDAIASGPGTVLGRYDNGVPLTNPSIPDELKNGFEVQGATLSPSIAGLRKIEIHLRKKATDKQSAEVQLLEKASNNAENNVKAARELEEAKDKAQKAKTDKERSAAKIKLIAALQLPDNTETTNMSIADLQRKANAAADKNPVADLQKDADNASKALKQKKQEVYGLKVEKLPQENVTTVQVLETPIVSINGTTIDLPYDIFDTNEGEVVIQANVKDSLISESGGGPVRVSWPFYPQDKLTSVFPLYNPSLAFEITRVSATKIMIRRIDGPSFVKAPENEGSSTCWKLLGGADNVDLPFPTGCIKENKTDTCKKASAKPEPSKCEEDNDKTTPSSTLVSDFAVTATVPELPDKIVLVAPNGALYNLTVPALKAKDDKTGPLELKQYDSQWIEIKAEDLAKSSASTDGAGTAAGGTSASGAKKDGLDLSQVVSVEANGKPLHFLKQENKPATTTTDTQKTPPPVKSIKVEITRELTSKPGTVDVGFHDAKGQLLGTRQLHIAQTDWSSKGDK